MPAGLHHTFGDGQIHRKHNWEVANAAALAALVPVSGDDGKVAWQLDTDEFYTLIDYAGPTWQLEGTGAEPAAHAASHQSGGSDAIKLDDLAAPDDNTDLNASTTAHGLSPKATAPAAGLLSVLGIANGETVRSDKAIFDTTNPAALGTAAPGTAVVAARRDHVHTLPKLDDLAAPDDNTDLNVSTTAHGLAPKLSNVATEYLDGTGAYSVPAGSRQLSENDPILFDAAGSADGKYSGLAIAGTAGATLAFGDLCYLAAADSRWELADADAEATSGGVMLGMCVLAAASDGDPTRMLLYGNIRADAAFPALTISAPAYVSTTAGDIQVAQPSGTDDVIRVVGHALTADELFFNPSQDWMTHT